MGSRRVPLKKGCFVNLKYAMDFLGLTDGEWEWGRRGGALPSPVKILKEYYGFGSGYHIYDLLLIKRQIEDKELRF